MKIKDLRATTVSVPLAAPLRHANGCHWGRFVRTVVEVESDNGLVSLGEMGGGGQSSENTFRALKSALLGWDPCRLEELRFRIANPTASLYNNHIQILCSTRIRLLGSARTGLGGSRLGNSGRAFKGPHRVCLLLVLSLFKSEEWRGRGPNRQSACLTRTRIEIQTRFQDPQTKRRCLPAAL